ncbi:hypothetical protein L3X37_00685 [Sabulilitoribacter arenilitoris]|uniref:DUF2975 domain-containing protein n=1 Tax=Wocania arenilitoris TaxID=2044858 RepID=A0AAE3EJV7_9FLAO|nr:hypothetical protein [Wocania arenilitoris]MCF7566881.1 hypothetical protein [Wocania arenilitoris]
MKKIKILLGFTLCFGVFYLFHLSSQVIYFKSWKKINEIYSIDSFFGKLNWLIEVCLSLILLTSVIFIFLALSKILKKGYFNITTSKSFKRAGFTLCFVSALDLVKSVLEISAGFHAEYYIGYSMFNVLLFLLSLGLLSISQIIRNGSLLKQENDLTI